MAFKNFRISIIVRVIVIAAITAALFYFLMVLKLYYSSLVIGALLVLAVIALIRYVERTNRELSQFLLSIKYGDYSAHFTQTGQGKSFNNLRESFNLIVSEFQRIRMDKEVHHQFLQTVVTNIPIGVICTDESGKVVIYNDAAQHLVNVNYLGTLGQVEKIRPELYAEIMKMKPGQTLLYRSEDNNVNLQIKLISFKLEEKKYNLLTLQNIKSELDFSEMQSWQKLIRVLTHEIMNSVTPITSLSSTLEQMLQENGKTKPISEVDEEMIVDISSGITAIRNRSKGLLSFVENYRNFTRVPQPEFSRIKVKDIFVRVKALMKSKLEENKIEFTIRTEDPSLEINADSEQVEQVLINLILNAIDAVSAKDKKAINLDSFENNGHIYISVKDNGKGIDKELQDKIFVPFFTTKEKGSGIGLSLSRQILLINRATISATSVQGEETVFVIKFS